MMKDRKYNIDEELLNMTDLELIMKYVKLAMNTDKSLAESLNERYHDICLIFLDLNYDETKKKEKMICCEQAKNAVIKWKNVYKTKHCLIISPNKMSPDAKKEFDVPRLNIMFHDFLFFPVGRHCMVPKHTALTEDEKTKFLKERKIELFQLPELKIDDPVSKYYGFKLHDIIQIDRPSWTVFRVVTL